MTTWTNVCVLCVRRVAARLRRELGREATTDEVLAKVRRLESGHVCAACAVRISDDLAAIVRLAADAAAFVAPGSSSGGGSRPVPSSRPPLNVDAVDPWFAIVDGRELTVLECLELWEREIRESRGMAPYGPASAARSDAAARTGAVGYAATLTGCTAFLRAQVAWIVGEPDFPVEDFADEIGACVRVLSRWDLKRESSAGRVVECPHDDGEGTCGYRLRIDGNDVDSYFHCPRCGSEWSVDRLMLVVAETTDASMWLDADAVIGRFGIDRKTLARWVREGRIVKSHGLYDIKPIALAQRRGA